jgi:transporter family-2 protein
MVETQPKLRSLALRDAGLISVGVATGSLTAMSISIIAAVGRQRGGEEATWLHLLVLLAAMGGVIGVVAARGVRPGFLRPLDGGPVIWVLAGSIGLLAALSASGLEWYYLTSGLISTAIFLMTTWLVVRVSLALLFATTTLGTVLGSLVLDQIGAFGAPEHALSLPRLLGVVLIVVGVVSVRTGK